MIEGGLNLVVFTPSKAKIDMDVEEKKLKFPPYVTPVLCGPEHYDLMKEALLFQQNEEKVKMPRWSTVKNYRENMSMGADISNAWNKSDAKDEVTCSAEMTAKYKWHDAILEVKEQGTAAAASLPLIVIVYDIFLPDISLTISCPAAATFSSAGAVFVAALEPVPSSM